MAEPRHVLILCTSNSARSQMAEGLVNHFRGREWRAASAGTRPAGFVHPLAIRVMAELGIDISGQASKALEALPGRRWERVITVCDSAAEECPLWLGEGLRQHLSFPDPAAAEGDEAIQLARFRAVRDDLRRRLLAAL
ncbi:MAG: arsenate reductase ArsC [Candidatus Promineifilaceae bacterium]